MKKVKRFIAKISWSNVETQEHPNGEFVLYSDYEALLCNAVRLKAENQRLNEQIILGKAIVPDAEPVE